MSTATSKAYRTSRSPTDRLRHVVAPFSLPNRVRPMRKPAFTVAALFATATLAACGGADETEYVNQVTKVQKATQTEASELSEKLGSATTPKQVGDNLDVLAKSITANASEL